MARQRNAGLWLLRSVATLLALLLPTHPALADALTAPSREATITVIGVGDTIRDLDALFRELLERDGVTCHVERAARFESDALFSRGADDPSVVVFVVLDASRARLYFRGPGGERFLFRRLSLEAGLDDVGKELVGQVVASSIMALLQSSEGLSRAEASVELSRDEPAPDERPPAPPVAAPVAPSRADGVSDRARPRTSRRSTELAVGARYVGLFSGPDFGLAQGPGIEASLGVRLGVLLRVRVLTELPFQRSLDLGGIAARLRTVTLRGMADLGWPLTSDGRIVAGFGAGVNWVTVAPRAAAPEVTLASPTTKSVPTLRGEVRYEHAFSALTLAAGGVVDWALVHAHYDLDDGATRRRLAAPFQVRPGFFVGVGLRH